MAVDADKAKNNVAAVMALTQGDLPDVVSAADLARVDAVLTADVQASRAALLTERRAKIPTAKTAAPSKVEGDEGEGEEEPAKEARPAAQPAPTPTESVLGEVEAPSLLEGVEAPVLPDDLAFEEPAAAPAPKPSPAPRRETPPPASARPAAPAPVAAPVAPSPTAKATAPSRPSAPVKPAGPVAPPPVSKPPLPASPIPPGKAPLPGKAAMPAASNSIPDELDDLKLNDDDLEQVRQATRGVKPAPRNPQKAARESQDEASLRNLFGALREEKKNPFDDLLGDVGTVPPLEIEGETAEPEAAEDAESEAAPGEVVEESPAIDPLADFSLDESPTDPEAKTDVETADEASDVGLPEIPADSIPEQPEEDAGDPLAGLDLGDLAPAKESADGPEIAEETDPLAGLSLGEPASEPDTDPLAGLSLGESSADETDAPAEEPAALDDGSPGAEEGKSDDDLAGLLPGGGDTPETAEAGEGLPELPDLGDEPALRKEPKGPKPAASPIKPSAPGDSSLSEDDILALTGASNATPAELESLEHPGESAAGESVEEAAELPDLGALEVPGEEPPRVEAEAEDDRNTDVDLPTLDEPVAEEKAEVDAGEPPTIDEEPPADGGAAPADAEAEAGEPMSAESGSDATAETEEPDPTSPGADSLAAFSVPDAVEGEDPRLRDAFIYLKTFGELNRKIVFDALTSGLLSAKESDRVFAYLVEGAEEESVVRYIYERMVEQNRLAPVGDPGGKSEGEPLRVRANLWPILRVAIVGGVAVALLAVLGVWLGTKIRAQGLYSHGLSAIEKRQWGDAEESWNKAFALSPSIPQAHRYADRYIARGRYYDAERKYQQALTVKSNHYETLFAWAKLFILKEEFPEAEKRLRALDQNGKGPLEVREELGRNFVEWGRRENGKWQDADRMYNTLLMRKKDHLPYLARKMQVAALLGNYTNARRFYDAIRAKSESFIEPEAHGDLMGLFVERYERHYAANPLREYRRAAPPGMRDDQLYLVRSLERTGEAIYKKDRKYVPNYYHMARWKYLGRDEGKARQLAERGVEVYENEGAPKYFEAAGLYLLLGMLNLQAKKVNDAVARLTTALEMDPENPRANYWMGRISLEHLDNLSNANAYFNRAILHWKTGEGVEWAGLLHGLGYTAYFMDRGGLGEDAAAAAVSRGNLTQSLDYWTRLREAIGRNYLVDYALGSVYLRLGEVELARGMQASVIDDLSGYLRDFNENKNYVSRDLRRRIEVLSDLYNNQGVAELAMAQANREPAHHRRSAAAHLVDSIDLKERLGAVRGTPTANFFLLRQNKPWAVKDLRIADALLPRNLDFISEREK